MPDTTKTGIILIKEGTVSPDALRFESEPCAPGWRLVKNLDRYGFGRKIHEGGWTFSSRAGQIGATVFGLDEQRTLRKAVEQILAERESAEFNSLEIMRVAWETSKRFLGALCECLRPITRYPGKRISFPRQGPSGEGPRTIGCRLNQSIGVARGNNELRQGEMIALIKVGTTWKSLRIRRRHPNENDAQCGHSPRYDPAFSSSSSWAGSFEVS